MTTRELDILKDFIRFCKKELGIQSLPHIKLITDPAFVLNNRSFGGYLPHENTVKVYCKGRVMADYLRSLAHELTHHRQMELNMLELESGETGSEVENEANAMAGILLREYGQLNSDIYGLGIKGSLNEVGEGTSAYKWRFDSKDPDGHYFYSFKTDRHDYTVGIADLEDGMYELSFNTVGAVHLDTNEGVMLKVLSTVTQITKDFIERADPEAVYFRPIKTGGDQDERRFKIYGAYLRKQLPPDYSLLVLGDVYRIIKKKTVTNEARIPIENETFSAYHGRYLFDVDKAYKLIKAGKVSSIIKEFNPTMLRGFSHPEFSAADPKKVAAMKIDYEKPVGILVKFEDPESKQTEWILIDGNHRARKATEEGENAKLYVITNPKDVNKFMNTDTSKPHKLFPDDDE